MKLNKKTLAKICGSYRTANITYTRRFAENEDGGIIYLHRPLLIDIEVTIFALVKGIEELPPSKLDELSYLHPLLIVLPCDIMKPELLLTLEKLERLWDERYPLGCGDSLCSVFLIYIVADAGRDSSTGERRYAYNGFSPEAIENIVKQELKKQGAPAELDLLSVSDVKMRTAIKKYIVSQGLEITLRQVNESIQKAKTGS
jgi:hypothetical protein